MTETRPSYTSFTLATDWFDTSAGKEPAREIAGFNFRGATVGEEVTINGVRYRRVRECRACKWWEQFKDTLPRWVDWGECKLAQQAGAAIESGGAASYDGIYEPCTNTRADFGCNQWAPKE